MVHVADEADAADPDLLIDFAKVSLRRGGQTLVGPITWAVELDERWVVIGPNGAGKTSLLRIAAAIDHPSSGTAYVLGERLGRTDMSELRSRVGLSSSALSQRIPDGEVVRDLVVSAGYAVLGRWREQYDDVDYHQAIDMLESVGAEHLAERTYGTLSEGERKRVLIARSMMTDPELLLLDEPAAGLDAQARRAFLDDLERALSDRATTVVHVSHRGDEALRVADRVMVLVGGRIRQLSDPGTLVRRPVDATVARLIGYENVLSETGAVWASDVRIGTGPLQAVVERVSLGPGRWEVVMTAHETLHAHLPLDHAPPQVGERVGVSFAAVTPIP